MEKTLEDLWYSYESQKEIGIGKEEKGIYDKMSASETMLRKSLSDEQKKWLDEYEDCFNELFSIAERKAFVKGVRFGAAFVFEVI